MKNYIISATLLVAMFGCGEADNRMRTPDPRFMAAEGCINDSTIQEIFDENGKPYYVYERCSELEMQAQEQ